MAAEWNLWAAQLIVEELTRLGVSQWVMCPGSRSAPLTLAVFSHPSAKWTMHFDERGAGFLGLGIAQRTSSPVVILTTSGSAVANLLPVAVEAWYTQTPLIFLTADRPPELIDCGANQAIRQKGIFGSYVISECDMPVPSSDMNPASILALLDGTLYKNNEGAEVGSGPVHINVPLREPLYPAQMTQGLTMDSQKSTSTMTMPDLVNLEGVSKSWLKSSKTYQEAESQPFSKSNIESCLTESETEEWFEKACRQGVILAGQLTPHEAKAAQALAFKLGWPIIADTRSHCRMPGPGQVICHYGLWMELEVGQKALSEIDFVLQIGSRFTEKRVQQWLTDQAPADHWLIASSQYCPDPDRRVTKWLKKNPQQTINELVTITANHPQKVEAEIHDAIQDLDFETHGLLQNYFSHNDKGLSELSCVRALINLLPDASHCFVGNSLPIRLIDLLVERKRITWHSQRGASGIDGCLAHGLGIARCTDQITTLIIGDLAFLHDLNSLALAKEISEQSDSLSSTVIIVMNNNGGNIFSFLPVPDAERRSLFQTPHNLSFEGICEGFGLSYTSPETLPEFEDAYMQAVGQAGVSVIELVVPENSAYQELEDLRNYLEENIRVAKQ